MGTHNRIFNISSPGHPAPTLKLLKFSSYQRFTSGR